MGSIIVFYIALIFLFAFFQWKVALLRNGKIDIETVHKAKSKKIKIIKQTIKYFAYQLKNYLHKIFIKFALFRMKLRVRISKFIESRLPGLHMFFAKRPEFADKHFKNFFWRGVIEYKYKMKKLKAQIREEEMQKSFNENEASPKKEIVETVLQKEDMKSEQYTVIDATEKSLKEDVIVQESIDSVSAKEVKPKRIYRRKKSIDSEIESNDLKDGSLILESPESNENKTDKPKRTRRKI